MPKVKAKEPKAAVTAAAKAEAVIAAGKARAKEVKAAIAAARAKAAAIEEVKAAASKASKASAEAAASSSAITIGAGIARLPFLRNRLQPPSGWI